MSDMTPVADVAEEVVSPDSTVFLMAFKTEADAVVTHADGTSDAVVATEESAEPVEPVEPVEAVEAVAPVEPVGDSDDSVAYVDSDSTDDEDATEEAE